MSNNYVPAIVLGTAIGDALGMPFETRDCSVHPMLVSWEGGFVPGNHHKLPAGYWTDDTEMTIELVSALFKHNAYDQMTAADNYLTWVRGTPTGSGRSTRGALMQFGMTGQIEGTKFDDPEAVGSGSAMRAAPLGAFYWSVPEMIRKTCKLDAYITHAHREAYAGSLAVAAFVAGVIRFMKYSNTQNTVEWRKETREFVESQLGVVEDTLTANAVATAFEVAKQGYTAEYFADYVAGRFGSVWQVVSTAIFCAYSNWHNFEAGVKEAVKLGGDADTRGAITGALLGAKFGIGGISNKLIEGVHQWQTLVNLDTLLHENSASKWQLNYPRK